MSSRMLLGVNIDHIATLRNARATTYPDPVQAAFIVEQAGADSVTVHLREDRRHITDRDIYLLRQTIKTKMNLEMSVTKEMIDIACQLKPNSCCLVPEKRKEITTEGGLDVYNHKMEISQAVSKLKSFGIQVSLFIDPTQKQITAAADIGICCVEIHTGTYANSIDETSREKELERIKNSAEYADSCNITVNAGHGLDYYNVKPIASLSSIKELNIGHAIISRSVMCGLEEAVKNMIYLIRESR